MNHSRLSAHVLHIPTLFILCSSFYLQTYTDIQSSRVTSLCYISEFLKHILALLGCFDILHLYFVEQLTNISPSPCPLVSVNVIDHSSLSAHVLHIPTLLSSAALSTFSYVPKPSHSQNIRHPYFVNNQLTFPPSPCPLVSVNEINHSSLSAHVLHISFPLYFIFRSEREKERQRAGKARVALL